ncbi:hypothetical protein HanPSC8_Chr04g0148511 [Helianthus annuus]|nr:hypothetical protein HanPSC8_Chr04g0148511 [Helianthus annuus]
MPLMESGRGTWRKRTVYPKPFSSSLKGAMHQPASVVANTLCCKLSSYLVDGGEIESVPCLIHKIL